MEILVYKSFSFSLFLSVQTLIKWLYFVDSPLVEIFIFFIFVHRNSHKIGNLAHFDFQKFATMPQCNSFVNKKHPLRSHQLQRESLVTYKG